MHVLCRAVLEEARTVPRAGADRRHPGQRLGVPDRGRARRRRRRHRLRLRALPGGTEEHAAGPQRPWVAHTNHFLGPVAARDTLAEGPSGPSTHGRMQQLVAALERTPAPDATELAALLASRGGPGRVPIFCADDPGLPWLERCATLATVGLEVPGGRVSLV